MTTATEQIIQSLTQNFQQALATSDLNRDGTIDRNELIQVLTRAATPWQVAQNMTNEIFNRLDRNRDGRLSTDDISGQVNQMAQQPQANMSQAAQQVINGMQQNFQQSLNNADSNRDGTIDRNELVQALMRASTPWQVANNIANEVFLKLDKNRDGRLSVQDVSQQIPNMGHHVSPSNPAVEQIIAGFRQNFQQTLQTADLNRDGTLDFNELVNALVRTNAPYNVAQTMAREVFQKLDTNHDGRIAAHEVTQQINNSTTLDYHLRTKLEQMIQSLTANFYNTLNQSDLNRDSTLDRNEVIQLLVRSNVPWNSAHEMADEFFLRLDKNRDGRISVQDVANQVPQSGHHGITPNMTYAQVYQMFLTNFEQAIQVADINQDGLVDQNELTNVLVRTNAPYQTAQRLSAFLFQQLDHNRDGRLSIHDIRPNAPSYIHHKSNLPLGRNLSKIGQGSHRALYIPYAYAGNSDLGGKDGWFDVYANSTEKWIEVLHEGGGDDHRVDDTWGGYRFIAFMFKACYPDLSSVDETKFRLSMPFDAPTEEEAINLLEAMLMGNSSSPIDLPDYNNEQSYLVEYYMVPLLSKFTLTYGRQTLLRIMQKHGNTFDRAVVDNFTKCAAEFKGVYKEGATSGLNYQLAQWTDPVMAIISAGFLLVMEGMMDVVRLQRSDGFALAKIRNGAKTLRACLDGITKSTTAIDILLTALEVAAITVITIAAVAASGGTAVAGMAAAMVAGVGAGGLAVTKLLVYKLVTTDNSAEIKNMERDMKDIMEKVLNMFRGSESNTAYLNDPEMRNFITPAIRSRIDAAVASGQTLNGSLSQDIISAFHWGIDYR
ncbi:EF-hand domain-containing protein [Pseudoalteromonas sp. T1lg65]|uniref:EF-hand domain-containing protein n=1 Tax=Pseudoalteromonas sp. T1lg65 TaxID=2077101 RepID=UPI003F7A8BF3